MLFNTSLEKHPKVHHQCTTGKGNQAGVPPNFKPLSIPARQYFFPPSTRQARYCTLSNMEAGVQQRKSPKENTRAYDLT